MTSDTPSNAVLRGRAIDVPILQASGEGRETVGIVFDCNVLADLEESFRDGVMAPVKESVPDIDPETQEQKRDPETQRLLTKEQPKVDADGKTVRELVYGIEAWQASMEMSPFATLRLSLAKAIGIDTREMGARMIPELLKDYFLAVGAAFAIANGVDPTKALGQAQEQTAELLRERGLESAGSETEASPATPGVSGPQPGPEPLDL